MYRTILKYLAYSVLSILGGLLIFIAISIAPIDYTPIPQQPFYHEMHRILENVEPDTSGYFGPGFEVGFAKKNITPSHLSYLVGSGLRREAKLVHDSIYVRTIVLSNGKNKVALIALDLLLVPPEVVNELQNSLPQLGLDANHVFFSATHTHTSIGGWGPGIAGHWYSGTYDKDLVSFLANCIMESIEVASKRMVSTSIKYGAIPVAGVLYNRLAGRGGSIDSLLRVVEFCRSDSSKLLLSSFTGHATCNNSNSSSVSRDYPGVLVDSLEAAGYNFAMFMAGAVGSHGCTGPPRGEERNKYVVDHLVSSFLNHRDMLNPVNDTSLLMLNVPLLLGEPQLKITKDIRIRPWLFNAVMGEVPHNITALKIGNLIMLGTPCDFSGELMPPLDSIGQALGSHVMVTSFNGGYIGYITLDDHYNIDHYETRIMSWYGPGNGAYVSDNLSRLIVLLSKNNP